MTTAVTTNLPALVCEFGQMALEIHCHHSGRSKIWDADNLEHWKSCTYTFCRRRYELLEELASSEMNCTLPDIFINKELL